MVKHDIPGEIIYLDKPTPTVETAADAVGTHPREIVKSVLFSIEDENILAIASGLDLIDRRIIAYRYGIGRKRVKLSPPDIVLTITGYPVGTVPPFGHKTAVPVLLDRRVIELEQVYAGGGAHNALVRLDPRDILHHNQAEVLDLHTPPA
jgi:prolyl-tRNA editing enzyme YbaK/EbsC (Cys-tRNA(Pro) deacylase)